MKRHATPDFCTWAKFSKNDEGDSKKSQSVETERYGLIKKDMFRYIIAFMQQSENIEGETLSSILSEFATECRNKKDLLLWLMMINFTRINGNVLGDAYKLVTRSAHKQNDEDFIEFIDYLNAATPKDRILIDVLTSCAYEPFVAPPKILPREVLVNCNQYSKGQFPDYGYDNAPENANRIKTEDFSSRGDDEQELNRKDMHTEHVFEVEQALYIFYGQLDFVVKADLSRPENLQKVVSCILEMQRFYPLCKNVKDVKDLGGLTNCLWSVIKNKIQNMDEGARDDTILMDTIATLYGIGNSNEIGQDVSFLACLVVFLLLSTRKVLTPLMGMSDYVCSLPPRSPRGCSRVSVPDKWKVVNGQVPKPVIQDMVVSLRSCKRKFGERKIMDNPFFEKSMNFAFESAEQDKKNAAGKTFFGGIVKMDKKESKLFIALQNMRNMASVVDDDIVDKILDGTASSLDFCPPEWCQSSIKIAKPKHILEGHFLTNASRYHGFQSAMRKRALLTDKTRKHLFVADEILPDNFVSDTGNGHKILPVLSLGLKERTLDSDQIDEFLL